MRGVEWGEGGGLPFTVDSDSGGLKGRVLKKWTIPVLPSVKKTMISLNHSSVNR